ncbi:membrane protein [Streptomyces sp. NRRL S-87]|uniref:LolA family protein n=1 Tax=Streptomyces sp. NRRL S-87 TaxID=1463920 RepID=UPI0004C1A480|nr:membrane protein [Streptomyces sp. NRRL S-87]
MAPNASGTPEGTPADDAAELRPSRRKAARYAVPVAVAGVAAATIGLVPALAANGSPDLPKISAQELLEKIAASDTEQLSGTAKVSVDLGLPSFTDGLLGGALAGATGGGGKGSASADPQSKLTRLASGTHTFKVAADGPDRQKLTLVEGKEEYSLIHDGKDVWGFDSASNQVFHETADEAGAGRDGKGRAHRGDHAPATPKEFAQEVLKAAGPTTDVRVGDTAQVAGRDAYVLVLEPKQSGSTIDSIKIAVDAKTSTPLRVQALSSEGGKPIVEAGFTKVSFGKPSADEFDFTPPPGAKVTEGKDAGKEFGGPDGKGGKDWGKGWDEGRDNPFKGLDMLPGLGDLTGGAKGGDATTRTIGEGWATITEITVPGGKGLGTAKGDKNVPKEAQGFLDSIGDKVSGKFGQGRVFSTRVINVLMTDDGKVYVGAVTKDALVKAADAAN